MARALIIDAKRQGYAIDQIRHTMTVGELISWLTDLDEDMLIYLSHDKGYTYGGITDYDLEEIEIEEDAK